MVHNRAKHHTISQSISQFLHISRKKLQFTNGLQPRPMVPRYIYRFGDKVCDYQYVLPLKRGHCPVKKQKTKQAQRPKI